MIIENIDKYDLCGFGNGLVKSSDGVWIHLDDVEKLCDLINELECYLVELIESKSILENKS